MYPKRSDHTHLKVRDPERQRALAIARKSPGGLFYTSATSARAVMRSQAI
jgi:hypothetical protein